MLITESLQHLRQFGNFKDFIAVLQCLDDGGNKLLRAMEPPRHDIFEPDRLPESQRAKGKLALRELGKAVRDIISKHAKNPVSDVSEVDELAPFFGDDSDESGGKKGDEENPQGPVIVRARKLPKPKPTRTKTLEEDDLDEGDEPGGDAFGEGPGGGGGGRGGGGGGGSGEGAGGGSSRGTAKLVSLMNVRALRLSATSQTVSVFSAVINKLHESYNGDQTLFERSRFRNLMRGINAVGGYRLLEFLEMKEMEALVSELAAS